MTVCNCSLVDGSLQACLAWANVPIIDTPKLGPCEGEIEILGDCVGPIYSPFATAVINIKAVPLHTQHARLSTKIIPSDYLRPCIQ